MNETCTVRVMLTSATCEPHGVHPDPPLTPGTGKSRILSPILLLNRTNTRKKYESVTDLTDMNEQCYYPTRAVGITSQRALFLRELLSCAGT